MPIRANVMMKRNVAALLRLRGQSQKSLAAWCRRSESWLSKALDERLANRVIPMRYYDKIADFLGVEVYQLFQPGVSATAERRSGVDRRVKGERRARATPDASVPHQAALLELFGLLSEQEQAKWIRTLGEQLTERRPRPSPSTAPAVQGSKRGRRKASGDAGKTLQTNERDAADERTWTPPSGNG